MSDFNFDMPEKFVAAKNKNGNYKITYDQNFADTEGIHQGQLVFPNVKINFDVLLDIDSNNKFEFAIYQDEDKKETNSFDIIERIYEINNEIKTLEYKLTHVSDKRDNAIRNINVKNNYIEESIRELHEIHDLYDHIINKDTKNIKNKIKTLQLEKIKLELNYKYGFNSSN